jgi:hypothetical protein
MPSGKLNRLAETRCSLHMQSIRGVTAAGDVDPFKELPIIGWLVVARWGEPRCSLTVIRAQSDHLGTTDGHHDKILGSNRG